MLRYNYSITSSEVSNATVINIPGHSIIINTCDYKYIHTHKIAQKIIKTNVEREGKTVKL